MLRITGLLLGKLSHKQLAHLAAQAADRSHALVRQRVERRAATMRVSEACGYVRARAAQIIHDQVELVLASYPQHASAQRPELLALATEAVVSSVIRDLTCLPMQQRGQLRRAA